MHNCKNCIHESLCNTIGYPLAVLQGDECREYKRRMIGTVLVYSPRNRRSYIFREVERITNDPDKFILHMKDKSTVCFKTDSYGEIWKYKIGDEDNEELG